MHLCSKRQQPHSSALRISPRAAASASTSANKMAGPKGKVLISVSDKTGLVDLVKVRSAWAGVQGLRRRLCIIV